MLSFLIEIFNVIFFIRDNYSLYIKLLFLIEIINVIILNRDNKCYHFK